MLTPPSKIVVIDWTKVKGLAAKAGGSTARLIRVNSQRAEAFKPEGQVNHWSAGDWLAFYDDYHYGVGFDPVQKAVIVARMLKPTEKGQHVWGENGAYMGFGFSAAKDATSTHAGPFPVLPEMMAAMAILKAESFAWTRIDPRGTHQAREVRCNRAKTAIAATGRTIARANDADHALLAKSAGYFPDRWDIGTLQPRLHQMTLEHYDDLKAHRVEFMFKDLLVA